MNYSAQKLAKTLYRLTQETQRKTPAEDFLNFCHEKNLDYLLPNILRHYKEIVAKNKANPRLHITDTLNAFISILNRTLKL